MIRGKNNFTPEIDYWSKCMGNNTQVDTLKMLVKKQQEHIKKLEQQVLFQDTIIRQYKSEIELSRKKTDDMVKLCSERLDEITALRDDYKNIVAETTQIRSEYDASLAELITSIHSHK